MSLLQPSWVSYFFSGALAVFISWALAGCRLGNHLDKVSNPDTISGYYETQPQTLTFCATHSTSQCLEANTNTIPGLVSLTMTNPVALKVADLTTGKAYLFNSNGTGDYLPVFAKSDGKLSFNGSTSPEILYIDPECTTQTFIEESGQFIQSETPTSSLKQIISGRVTLKVQVIQTFDGKCAETLQQLESCYEDSHTCDGTTDLEKDKLQQAVQAMFNPYIETGVMSLLDISDISVIAYEVAYQ